VISKNFLIFIHNSSIALQIATYLKKYNLGKKYKLIIFIENNKNNLELKKEIDFIFKKFRFRIIHLKIKKFNLFTINNFFKWRKIFFINKFNYNYLKNLLDKNKINLNDFDEIFYSNERSSKYINHMFKGKKIFFFHGIGDVKIFTKQNYIKEIKNLLFYHLNFKFNKVEIPRKNSLTAVLFKNFIKFKFIKKNMNNINQYHYNFNFIEFSKKKINDIKFKAKDRFILYILKFPRFKVGENNHHRAKYLINYLNFQFMKVDDYINQNSILKKCNIVIKTKNNITEKEIKIIDNLAKNSFKKNKIQLLTSKKDSYVNAEVFASHKKCKAIISNFSTVDFLVNIINSKIKIFQYNRIVTIFNMNNKFYTTKNIDIKSSELKKYYKMDKHITI
jgi:hypothetical protein